jgi:signal transduction histidine kinase
MRFELNELLALVSRDGVEEHWLALMDAGWLALVSWSLWYRGKRQQLERRRERLLREELEAYARLDATLPPGGDARTLAKRICRMVAEKSAFRRAALLLRDAEGRLYVAGSSGMDDLAVAALTSWGTEVVEEERGAVAACRQCDALPQDQFAGARVGMRSFLLDLPSTVVPKPLPAGRMTILAMQGRAILLPMRTASGLIAGALAVSPDEEIPPWAPALEEAVPPLEALAAKIGQAMESAALTERLMRAEKLASLGQLAGGVAHELNNPLTAVLGFAELIAETANEVRVRGDARTIVTEALRMKEIVQNLVDFWRPAAQVDRPVEVVPLLEEVIAECAARLEELGVRVEIAAPGSVPPIRGDSQRLRVVLEHLLNNAVQAIDQVRERTYAQQSGLEEAGSGPPGDMRLQAGDAEPPAIRVTVSESSGGLERGGRAVHVVVSDTGPGFREPSRVFDPFYTTRQPGDGPGLGLSICYGIVREHGGEISAFNLHPHGAAVVVELPVRETIADESAARVVVRKTAQ